MGDRINRKERRMSSDQLRDEYTALVDEAAHLIETARAEHRDLDEHEDARYTAITKELVDLGATPTQTLGGWRL